MINKLLVDLRRHSGFQVQYDQECTALATKLLVGVTFSHPHIWSFISRAMMIICCYNALVIGEWKCNFGVIAQKTNNTHTHTHTTLTSCTRTLKYVTRFINSCLRKIFSAEKGQKFLGPYFIRARRRLRLRIDIYCVLFNIYTRILAWWEPGQIN